MLELAQLITGSDLTPHLSVINSVSHFHITDLHSSVHMDLIAQQFKQDVMGDVAKGWSSFVKSGQIWALMIGLIVGYLFRSITNA